MSMIGAMIFVAYFAWVLSESDPNARIEKACSPVLGVGKVFVAGAEMSGGDLAGDVEDGFVWANSKCRYMVWRVFYSEEYERLMTEARKKLQQKDSGAPGEE